MCSSAHLHGGVILLLPPPPLPSYPRTPTRLFFFKFCPLNATLKCLTCALLPYGELPKTWSREHVLRNESLSAQTQRDSFRSNKCVFIVWFCHLSWSQNEKFHSIFPKLYLIFFLHLNVRHLTFLWNFHPQVIPFGVDCSEDECACRDPEAKENKSKLSDGRGGAAGGSH